MLLQRPFAAIAPTVDGDVLAVLARSDASFTAGQVHNLMGTYSYSGVAKALARLVAQGTVRSQRIGSTTVYALNREHLAAGAILELAGIRGRFLERLRAAFDQWEPVPVFAALFGSAARGDMAVGSDIDIFIVRPAALEEASDAENAAWSSNVGHLQESVLGWTGNDSRVYEVGERELGRDLVADDPVLASIRREGIPLSGPREFWSVTTHGRTG
ncbi:MAG: hypothetical protein JWP74_764 [Marmoricola sp.]|nr:hypothetical protein [Marmoricola sp.]